MSDTSTATLLYPTAACALLKFGTVERERDGEGDAGRRFLVIALFHGIRLHKSIAFSQMIFMVPSIVSTDTNSCNTDSRLAVRGSAVKTQSAL